MEHFEFAIDNGHPSINGETLRQEDDFREAQWGIKKLFSMEEQMKGAGMLDPDNGDDINRLMGTLKSFSSTTERDMMVEKTSGTTYQGSAQALDALSEGSATATVTDDKLESSASSSRLRPDRSDDLALAQTVMKSDVCRETVTMLSEKTREVKQEDK